MSDQVRALEVLIKTVADLVAAEKAHSAYKKVVEVTKEGTAENAHAKAQVDALSAALNTEHAQALRVADSIKKAEEATKELVQGHSQFEKLGEAVKDLKSEVPGLGAAFELAKNPYVELIAVMGEGLAVLKQHEAVFIQLSQHGADHTNIDEYTEAVKNLKKWMGNGMEEAAHVFTQAMHGHYRELQRSGIEIDKSLDKHQQLESIMKQLADGGGRLAEARAKTLTGAFQELKHDTHELFLTIGQLEKDTGILQNTMGLLGGVVKTLTMFLPATKAEIEGLSEKFNENAFSARENVEALDAEGMAMDSLGTKADSAKEKIEAQTKAIEEQAKALEEKRVQESELVDQQTKADIAAIRSQQAMDKPTPENKLKYDKLAADREAKGQNDLLALRSKNLDEDLKAEATKKSDLKTDKQVKQIQADAAHEELAQHQKDAGFGEGDFNYTDRAKALTRNKRDMEEELEQLRSEYNTGTMAADAMKKAGDRILEIEKELEEMPKTIKALHTLDEERQAAGKLKEAAAKAAEDLAKFEKGEAERVAKLKFEAAKLGLQITEAQWKQMEAQAKIAADAEKADHEKRKKTAEDALKAAEETQKKVEQGGSKSPQAAAAVAAAKRELDRINAEAGSAHPQPTPGPIRPLPIYQRQTNDLPAGVTPEEQAKINQRPPPAHTPTRQEQEDAIVRARQEQAERDRKKKLKQVDDQINAEIKKGAAADHQAIDIMMDLHKRLTEVDSSVKRRLDDLQSQIKNSRR